MKPRLAVAEMLTGLCLCALGQSVASNVPHEGGKAVRFGPSTNAAPAVETGTSLSTNRGLQTYVYVNPSWVVGSWAGNLKASGLHPCDGFFVVAAPPYAQDGLNAEKQAMEELRVLGFAVVPGIGMMLCDRLGHHDLTAWTDSATWSRATDWLRGIAPLIKGKLVLDMEPYWEGDQRYPPDSMQATVTAAMQPFLAALKATGAKLYVCPAGPEYLANKILAAAGLEVTQLDEVTYSYTSNGVTEAVSSIDLRKRKTGGDYRPGLFGYGLTRTDLLPALAGHVDGIWFWFRSKQDDYWNFGKTNWAPRP